MANSNGEWIIKTNDLSTLPDEFESVLLRLGEEIIEDANETVPFDTGDLMRSGQALHSGRRLEVDVVYDRPYALVHENAPDGKYNYQSPEARSGWVQKTIKENAHRYIKFVAEQAGRDVKPSIGFVQRKG